MAMAVGMTCTPTALAQSPAEAKRDVLTNQDAAVRPLRHTWEISAVVDVDGAAAACRNYWEFRDLRDVLTSVVPGGTADVAYDVGCGYGRLLNLLGEYAASVVGFEREPSLVEHARRLSPGASLVQVPALAPLPAPDASADIVLCFTVLQHLTDAELARVVPELLRVRRPSGAIILVEETDASLEAGKAERADLGYTKGRTVSAYAALLAPLALVHAQPRRNRADLSPAGRGHLHGVPLTPAPGRSGPSSLG